MQDRFYLNESAVRFDYNTSKQFAPELVKIWENNSPDSINHLLFYIESIDKETLTRCNNRLIKVTDENKKDMKKNAGKGDYLAFSLTMMETLTTSNASKKGYLQ